MKVTAKSLKEEIIGADTVSLRDGIFTFRREFFYTGGKTAEEFASLVKEQLEKLGLEAEVIDSGSHWAPFRGGASTRKSSHWWVKIKITH